MYLMTDYLNFIGLEACFVTIKKAIKNTKPHQIYLRQHIIYRSQSEAGPARTGILVLKRKRPINDI